jgi:hypothetical protein
VLMNVILVSDFVKCNRKSKAFSTRIMLIVMWSKSAFKAFGGQLCCRPKAKKASTHPISRTNQCTISHTNPHIFGALGLSPKMAKMTFPE